LIVLKDKISIIGLEFSLAADYVGVMHLSIVCPLGQWVGKDGDLTKQNFKYATIWEG